MRRVRCLRRVRTFRNGAVPVKLHFSIADRRDTIIRSRSLGACGRLYPPGVVRRSFRGHRGTGSGLDDCNASLVLRRNHDPGCVRRQALASVRGQRGGCQLHAWSKTIPECQSQSRARTRWYGSATRPTTCIIGNRVPARGHRWISKAQVSALAAGDAWLMRLSDAAIARLRPREREYTVWDSRMPGLGVRVPLRRAQLCPVAGGRRAVEAGLSRSGIPEEHLGGSPGMPRAKGEPGGGDGRPKNRRRPVVRGLCRGRVEASPFRPIQAVDTKRLSVRT